MKAYFVDGLFIGSIDVLVDIAVAAGLQAAQVREFLSDDGQRDAVSQADAQARQMGVNGVPFFIFNQRLALSGAQPPEVIVEAMEKAREELVATPQ